MFIISKEAALKYQSSATPTTVQSSVPASGDLYPPSTTHEASEEATGLNIRPVTGPTVSAGTLKWTGEITPQKWINFYTKVLSRFAAGSGLKLTVSVEVSQEDGISSQKLEDTKTALRELGLKDDIRLE